MICVRVEVGPEVDDADPLAHVSSGCLRGALEAIRTAGRCMGGSGRRIVALEFVAHISARIRRSRVREASRLLLLGPNGTGKSTFRLLVALPWNWWSESSEYAPCQLRKIDEPIDRKNRCEEKRKDQRIEKHRTAIPCWSYLR